MTRQPLMRPFAPRRSRGFSLVELLVASAIGLLLALGLTSMVVTAGRQASVIGANSNAQSSAQVALAVIDMAARSAGAGFYSNHQAICPTWNAWNGTAVVSDGAAWMAARIVDGGAAGASDQLVFTGGSGNRALSAAPVMTDTLGANIKVSNSSSFVQDDLALVGAPGSGQPCTLFQVAQAPSLVSVCGGNSTFCQLLVRTPNTGLNPVPTAFTTQPVYGFDTSGAATAAPAVVSLVGSAAAGFRQDAFAVQCGALVRYNAFATATLPPCTASPLSFGAAVDAIAPDIVLMQAQYGVSASAASDVVTQWVEPAGATWGGTPTVANIARIKAVRIVLVARSREADAGLVTQACTNTSGVANTGPCSFEDAAAPVIDVSGVPVPAGRSWQNYRYRVHTAVLPLRTVIWSD
jgi:type IV pilus assembly protein PilW